MRHFPDYVIGQHISRLDAIQKIPELKIDIQGVITEIILIVLKKSS